MQGGQVVVRQGAGAYGVGLKMGNMFKFEGTRGGSGTLHACSVTGVIVLMGCEALLGVACHRMQARFDGGERHTTLLQDSCRVSYSANEASLGDVFKGGCMCRTNMGT